MKTKMTLKQKLMTGSIGAIGLAFVAHSVGILTGWYDLGPVYDMLNVDPSTFGWTTLSAPGAYLVARVGLDGFKSNQKYKLDLDKYNTDRLVFAQIEAKEATLASNAKMDELISQNAALLKLEADKAAKYAELEAKLSVDNLKENL